ncbi:MAG: ribonuclease III domain-containing protein [Eubacteriales bacterium]|jgi:ribonuclease-3 family protein|nr:ribonuclease III domain-containing protein [Eubacteriales bacterium]
MSKKINPKEINTTALAYIGDAVYEIYVRKHVMETGQFNADKLHQMAVKYVRADGQAKAVKELIREVLDEDETRLVKRARNHKTTSKPKNADPVIYKLATAFEALVGYLYLEENCQRLEEVIEFAFLAIERGE